MNVVTSPLIILSLITAAPAAPPSAFSGFMNLERLMAHCAPAPNAETGMADVCMGYVAGAVDQLLSRQSALPPTKRTVCLPPNVTIGDLQRAVIAQLETTEDEPDTAAAWIVERAVVAAYSC